MYSSGIALHLMSLSRRYIYTHYNKLNLVSELVPFTFYGQYMFLAPRGAMTHHFSQTTLVLCADGNIM